MPVTPEQAISAAMRGVMRTLNAEPPQATRESYHDFLHFVRELGYAAEESMLRASMARSVGSPDVARTETEHSYFRVLSLAVTALLALAHHPHLDEIDKALPTERLES